MCNISQYQCRLNKSLFPSSTLSSLLPTLATNYSKKLMNHICTISGRENIFFSLIRVSWVQQQVRHEAGMMLQLCPNEASLITKTQTGIHHGESPAWCQCLCRLWLQFWDGGDQKIINCQSGPDQPANMQTVFN